MKVIVHRAGEVYTPDRIPLGGAVHERVAATRTREVFAWTLEIRDLSHLREIVRTQHRPIEPDGWGTGGGWAALQPASATVQWLHIGSETWMVLVVGLSQADYLPTWRVSDDTVRIRDRVGWSARKLLRDAGVLRRWYEGWPVEYNVGRAPPQDPNPAPPVRPLRPPPALLQPEVPAPGLRVVVGSLHRSFRADAPPVPSAVLARPFRYAAPEVSAWTLDLANLEDLRRLLWYGPSTTIGAEVQERLTMVGRGAVLQVSSVDNVLVVALARSLAGELYPNEYTSSIHGPTRWQALGRRLLRPLRVAGWHPRARVLRTDSW